MKVKAKIFVRSHSVLCGNLELRYWKGSGLIFGSLYLEHGGEFLSQFVNWIEVQQTAEKVQLRTSVVAMSQLNEEKKKKKKPYSSPWQPLPCLYCAYIGKGWHQT
mmetsp:Transcript_38980/g.51404  ORF Transcript_38980/g.51404 Transcript_38980/m.51404 type:complete len:105 (-) Transcript_38980:1437-1751(-)